MINHRCVLGVTQVKPISVLSLIPFKSQVCLNMTQWYLGGGVGRRDEPFSAKEIIYDQLHDKQSSIKAPRLVWLGLCAGI